MKFMRWISLMLIVVLSLSMVAGCAKTPQEDEMGVVDTVVPGGEAESNPDDTKDPDDNKEPADNSGDTKEPADTKDPNGSKDPGGSKEPADPDTPVGNDQPGNDKEPADTTNPGNGEEPGNEGNGQEKEEWVPMEKETSGTSLTLISQNVKHAGYTAYGEKGDGTGNNIYNRLRRFKTLVLTHDPDIIFFNEAKETAKRFFNEDGHMSQTYNYVWQDRHSTLAGHIMSEPVLWKTSKFETLETGHFWISPTPNNEGPGFSGQAGADVSTWVKLKVKKTGEIVYAYCLHTYHGADNRDACVGALKLYYQRFKQMEKGAYAFVGGDYNTRYRSSVYEEMMDWEQIVDLRDVAMMMNKDGLCTLGGMYGSFNGTEFNNGQIPPEENRGNKTQIDHITMKPNPHVAVDHYGFDYTVYDYAAEGIAQGMISDHWALVVKVRINTTPDYSQYHQPYDYGEGSYYFN